MSVGVAIPAQAVVGGRCGFATLIGVRGTDEPAGSGLENGGRTYVSGGLGNVVGNLAIGLQGHPVIPFHIEGLVYPAVVLDPGNPTATNYFASLNIGEANLRAEISNLAIACPTTVILLAGYSQGAQVISDVLAGSSLSASVRSHIGEVVLYGSPTFHAGEAWNAPGSGTSNGIFGSSGNPGLASYKRLVWLPPTYTTQGYLPTIRSYCLSGDEFCQTNLTTQGAEIHASYPLTSVMNDSMVFIMNWLISTD